jgi:Tol biopolymer transport system component
VAFLSNANDLVPNDSTSLAGSDEDCFVRDLQTGTTKLVSVNHTGSHSANNVTFGCRISADGHFVAFDSNASDLIANNSITSSAVYVRNLQTGTTVLVSVNRDGIKSRCDFTCYNSWASAISADGRFVAFTSNATDLLANDTTFGLVNIFVRDLLMGVTKLVSVNRTGTNGGDHNSGTLGCDGCLARDAPVISADGRFVAFTSFATDLVTNNIDSGENVFVRDLQKGMTTLVSVNQFGTNGGTGSTPFGQGSSGPAISADGRFVVFASNSSDLVPADTNGEPDLFIRPVP